MPFDSPMYFGLSSQVEEPVEEDVSVVLDFSKVLSGSMVDADVALFLPFSVIMIGGFAEITGWGGALASILGGGTPVSFSKGVSGKLGPEVLAVAGGPASSGVLKAFSQEPALGSLEPVARAEAGTGGAPTWAFSILSSATCASSTRLRFIRFSSIWSALSSRIPGLSPLWNLKARIIDKMAIMTRTAMSTVVKESWGNRCNCPLNWSVTEGLFA